MKFRIFNVIVSLSIAIGVYLLLVHLFFSILPDSDNLSAINHTPTAILHENSNGVREQYTDAFIRAIKYSFVSFFVSLLIIEYIRSGFSLRKMAFSDKIAAAMKRIESRKSSEPHEKEEILREYLSK